VAAVLTLLTSLASCEGAAPPPALPFTLVDSAGVELATSSADSALSPTGWSVAPEPDLMLGDPDSGPDFFYRIQGVRGLPDAGLLVVDGGSRELRFYDASGQRRAVAGGEGQGPGEFIDPVLVPQVGLDSIVVFDTRLIRFSVYSNSGVFGRVTPIEQGRPYGGRAPVGAIGMRHLLMDRRGTEGGPETPTPDEGLVRTVRGFLWYDAADGTRARLDSLTANFIYYERGSMRWLFPFVPLGSAATTATAAYVSLGDDIQEVDPSGRMVRRIRVEGLSRTPTDADLSAYADWMRVDRPYLYESVGPEDWKAQLERHDGPARVPAFDRVLVDTDELLWVRVYQIDPRMHQTWIVFDRSGRPLGTVRIPGGVDVRWIGERAILGVVTDAFDVEYVHRYPLRRGSAAP
jgi:hypothetical protein